MKRLRAISFVLAILALWFGLVWCFLSSAGTFLVEALLDGHSGLPGSAVLLAAGLVSLVVLARKGPNFDRQPSGRIRLWIIAVGLGLAHLWFPTAYPRGMLMAHLDHARSHDEVWGYGYPPPWSPTYHQLLQQKYGVVSRTAGGCSPFPPWEWYADGYNGVSGRLLIEKYHRDIFEECADSAIQQWNIEHPEDPWP